MRRPREEGFSMHPMLCCRADTQVADTRKDVAAEISLRWHSLFRSGTFNRN